MDYLDEVTNKLTELLKAIPASDRAEEMDEMEATAGEYLNLTPRRDRLWEYSLDLFSDPNMRELVSRDKELRNVVNAESPVDMILRLIPSDGHLE
jgi:hypothetical protein